MKRKHSFAKIFALILTLSVVTVFALVESGDTPDFFVNYTNNFKRNILGICNKLNVELPIEIQLYLDGTAPAKTFEPMTPSSSKNQDNESKESLAYPGYKEEEAQEKKGDATLTAKKKYEKITDLPTAFPSAENTKFSIYNGKVICVNETEFSKYKLTGEQIWKQKIQMQNPILTVSGKYILISETGGKKISLYEDKKLLFSEKTEGNILTADLSPKGDVVCVTEKEYYKGQVVVFNKAGKKIFVWDSGSYSILDASVSKTRKVAISLLSTDAGADSIIEIFNVDGKKLCKTEPFIDTIIFDVRFYNDKLLAISETKFMTLSLKGKIKKEYSFDNRRLQQYDFSDNGIAGLLFDNLGTGEIVTLNSNAKVCGTLKTQDMPFSIDINSKLLAYNNGRQAVIANYNGKKILVSDCDADIKQVHITGDDRVFCVFAASFQEKELEKKKKIEDITVETEKKEEK